MSTELKALHISAGTIFIPFLFILPLASHFLTILLGAGCIIGGCVLKYVQVRQSVRIKVSNLQSVPIV
jgi:hypothetical protein